jgi:hypothetical protein
LSGLFAARNSMKIVVDKVQNRCRIHHIDKQRRTKMIEEGMIKVKTTGGHDTDITVQLLDIHGAMKIIVITDQADEEQIAVYDDEIDGLIEALNALKGGLR